MTITARGSVDVLVALLKVGGFPDGVLALAAQLMLIIPLVARPGGHAPFGFAVGGFRVTSRMRLVLLWWISRLPSPVGRICRTMPA